MPIQSGDVKLLKSALMADVPEGGGAPTGLVIADGVSNAIFPDISELDRAGGRVNLRKSFVQVAMDDTDTYFGANVIVAEPPQDERVSVTLFSTRKTFATREQAQTRIEAYLNKGPEWAGYLFENHIAGQRVIQLFQRLSDAVPNVGQTLVLIENEGLPTQKEQYIRATAVSVVERSFIYNTDQDYKAAVVTVAISDALRFDFTGSPASRTFTRATISTKTRDTVVADAGTYVGVAPLTQAANVGDFTLKGASSYTQLVPSAQTETPISFVSPYAAAGLPVPGAAPVSYTASHAWNTSIKFNLPGGCLPGSLSIVTDGITIFEAAALSAGAAAATPGDAAVAVAPPKIDLAMMGPQTRSLLDLALTVSLLAGLWWIWKGALPALSTIGDVALWSATGGDGRPATAITLSQLGFAIVIVSITWVAVRNVGALLDTLLLQRLEFRADANYAIKVVSRYAITAVGVLLACDRLGIAWSDAQWLIAALGVGLGFGLQEIVANFVSGLIVLAERPVRIGDVVTVGEVSGTVSGIMARSTSVIDFDNKEVIIPNKAFITERVVNWTLSDPTTRLVLKVGVAYGTDIAQAQRLMLDAVRSNPDVQRSPAASVYFTGFGESSLDFEIRAFVAAYDLRLRVRHEILFAIERALREHGIEIPFPQRELHIRAASGPGPSDSAGGSGPTGSGPHPA